MNSLADWQAWVSQQQQSPDFEHRISKREDLTEWFPAEAEVARGAIERAIRQYASTQQWPPLPPHVAIYLQFRLNLAAQILEEVSRNPKSPVCSLLTSPPSPTQFADSLDWLLVDCWNHLGPLFLKHCGEEIHRGQSPQ